MKEIKMKDCRFYVNKDARMVVCVIPNTRDMMLDFICQYFRFSDVDFWSSTQFHLDRRLALPHSFSGKAICAPEDEWNEETGKLIAFSKARDKCYKSFYRRANMFAQVIDARLGDIIERFNDFGIKLEKTRSGMNQKIEELTKNGGDA